MKTAHAAQVAASLVAFWIAACSANSGIKPQGSGGSGGTDSGSGTGGMAGDSGTGATGGTLLVSVGGDAGCDETTGKGCGDPEYVPACSNGIIDSTTGELCDDGNADSGDGCTANCDQLEENFVCPTPDSPCVTTVECGDGKITGDETCDDGNGAASDGCDDECQLELGWACPIPGIRCQAWACGDGIIAGKEQCDFGGTVVVGCDAATCQINPLYACDAVDCHLTLCGDSNPEGSEACDDGNHDWSDGCTPTCHAEPDCSAGECTSTCGDGILLPGSTTEDCDDGNSNDGDGCSSSCQVEEGYVCEAAQSDMKLPMMLRDFIGWCPVTYDPSDDNSACDNDLNDTIVGNFDFELYHDQQIDGIVENTLDVDGKPVNAHGAGPLTPDGSNGYTRGQTNFQWWYRDNFVYNKPVLTSIQLVEISPGTWRFTRAAGDPPQGENPIGYNQPFFPLDQDPPGADPVLPNLVVDGAEKWRDQNRNFSFTSEVRYWFQYNSNANPADDPVLTFYGDDDVWVFIKNTLAADIGSIHRQAQEEVTLTDDGDASVYRADLSTGIVDLNLQDGEVYEIVVFQAERCAYESNYQLTLQGFSAGKSACVTVCGDGIVTPDEACDDGVNVGGYNGCEPGCQARGAYCGDTVIQTDDGETCDDGVNLSQYGGCAPGCVAGPFCGDGKVQPGFEFCDDGVNDGGYSECDAGCLLGPRCGDGELQAPDEECDDGNRKFADGCNGACKEEVIK